MLQTRLTNPNPKSFLAFACRAKEWLQLPNVDLARQRLQAAFSLEQEVIRRIASQEGIEQAISYAAGMIVYGHRTPIDFCAVPKIADWRPARSSLLEIVVGSYIISAQSPRPYINTARFLSRGVPNDQAKNKFTDDHVRRALRTFAAQSARRPQTVSRGQLALSPLEIQCACFANEVRFLDALWAKAKSRLSSTIRPGQISPRSPDAETADKLAVDGSLFDWQRELEADPPFEPTLPNLPKGLIEVVIRELRERHRSAALRENLASKGTVFATRS
ncbi:hypothetical protein BJF93_15415 [Xaviernesmea oryzae]|uniref:Uncharacterized protein n=1 Tax=Xaviernesmea oryzae TaxID=464029 RepID=A0A1Q9AY33_9HYPH|nr:hypothetical protein [Xaviernesmea oryzae]OLP60344.1 hypothetical protein BJF93_15415 [Xaviernesmea oryzae]SEK22464.1 hypothetical protein SAMN04487976_101134 [Xaviernesmea oryzae]